MGNPRLDRHITEGEFTKMGAGKMGEGCMGEHFFHNGCLVVGFLSTDRRRFLCSETCLRKTRTDDPNLLNGMNPGGNAERVTHEHCCDQTHFLANENETPCTWSQNTEHHRGPYSGPDAH